VEHQPTVGAAGIHTVQREDMEVDVQIQRGSEALHDGHWPRARVQTDGLPTHAVQAPNTCRGSDNENSPATTTTSPHLT
jgi:hypothetical protein